MRVITPTLVIVLAAVSAAGQALPPGPRAPVSQVAANMHVADAYYEFLLGRHYESEGEIERAIEAHREAARLDPASAEIRAELAGLFARQGRVRDARTEARAALTLDPGNREANRVLGSLVASTLETDDKNMAAPPAVEEAIGYLERGRRTDGIDEDPTLDITLARLYLRAQRYSKAVALLSALLDKEPMAEAYLLLAQAHQSAGHSQDAIRALEAGADLNPRLLVPLAEFYERQQNWDRAGDAYRRASEANPQSLEVKMRWAAALLNQTDDASLERARDLAQEVVTARPTDDRALYLLSQAQRRARDLEAAEATARRLQEVDSSGLWGTFALAQVYEDRRQYRRVVETLGPIVDRAPSDDSPQRQTLVVLTHLGFAQMQLGDYDGAIASFERARGHADGDVTYDVYLAQAYVSARQYDKARQILEPLRKRRPADVRLAQLESRALAGAGDRDGALALMRETVQTRPGDPAPWLALANLLSDASRTPEALDVLDQAASRFPDNLTVPFQRGAVYERAKDYARAEEAFRAVVAKDPLHAPALNYLGYMFADRGVRLDEAVELIQRALKVDPGNGSYLDSLGWAYFKQRKLDDAKACLEKAADQLPANSVVQDHLGDVLAALGERGEAIAAWERALAGDRDGIEGPVLERKIQATREQTGP